MIVGFSGLAGSGKSTAADFLEKKGFAAISLADPIKRIAKQVYRFTTEQLWGPSACRNAPDRRYLRERHDRHDWSMDGEPAVWTCVRCGTVENTPTCDVYLTPRFAIQTLGTEWGRRCYPNTWVDLALLDADQITSDQGERFRYVPEFGLVPRAPHEPRATGVVIPDVRMQNELDGLKAAGAPVYRIVRPAAGLRGSSAKHESESGQLLISDDEFTQVLLNNGPLVALHTKVERVVFRTSP